MVLVLILELYIPTRGGLIHLAEAEIFFHYAVRSLHSDLHLQTHGGLIHLAEAEILVHYFRVIHTLRGT